MKKMKIGIVLMLVMLSSIMPIGTAVTVNTKNGQNNESELLTNAVGWLELSLSNSHGCSARVDIQAPSSWNKNYPLEVLCFRDASIWATPPYRITGRLTLIFEDNLGHSLYKIDNQEFEVYNLGDEEERMDISDSREESWSVSSASGSFCLHAVVSVDYIIWKWNFDNEKWEFYDDGGCNAEKTVPISTPRNRINSYFFEFLENHQILYSLFQLYFKNFILQ